MGADRRRRDAGRDGRIEDARAVEVEAQVELPRGSGDRLDLLQPPDAASGRVVRVLDGDDPRRRNVRAIGDAHRLPKLLRREAACLAVKRPSHQAGVHRRAAELGEQDVRVLLRDDLVARTPERAKRDLVRHRRRRDEDRLRLAEQGRGAALELVDGRVLAPLLVADLGRCDRGAHLRRRLRLRVRAELDHAPLGASMPAAAAGSAERSG
jgi:hypothetical protein